MWRPSSLVFEESVELEGATVNWSKNGVLIVANGRISVQIKIEGHTYRGRLVRAFPEDSVNMVCGIELFDPWGS